MALLDNLLSQAQPGVNPQLEDMIGKMMLSGGATPGQVQSGQQGLQQPQTQNTLASGAQGMPGQPGAAQPMDPQAANQTLQILIRKGVPPQIAQQALQNPKLLRELLAQIYQPGGAGPQGPAQGQGTPMGSQSAPPLGGGGGY